MTLIVDKAFLIFKLIFYDKTLQIFDAHYIANLLIFKFLELHRFYEAAKTLLKIDSFYKVISHIFEYIEY